MNIAKDILQSKVELHVHLDGAVRLTTIWELSKKKNLELPGDGSLQALEQNIVVTIPKGLSDYLSGFKWIIQALQGDLEAIERVSYEFVQDKAADGLIYVETRCSSQILMSSENGVSADDVTKAVLKGLRRGETDFGIKVRLILVCIRAYPEWAMETLDLCTKYRNEGVVGIDIAGDEAPDVDKNGELQFHPSIISAFREAKERGIHRTVHASEAGPADAVLKAMELLYAERIGHGYHAIDVGEIYSKALKSGIHFETCPYSSILTGSVSPTAVHPIIKLANDNANFSISTDATTVTNATLTQDYQLLLKWGLTETQIHQTKRNAARSAFIPDDEKQAILNN
ncbi:hypothetical protein CHUAL_001843 [Chamberlinius hualienensis]